MVPEGYVPDSSGRGDKRQGPESNEVPGPASKREPNKIIFSESSAEVA